MDCEIVAAMSLVRSSYERCILTRAMSRELHETAATSMAMIHKSQELLWKSDKTIEEPRFLGSLHRRDL
jgi:hypothetical protein